MTTQPQTQALTVVDSLRKMEPEFRLALPKHIESERFTRIAVSAVNGNPALLANDIDKRSLYSACMKAAQDGLVIDGREAALVTFNSKNGKQVQYLPMVAGILKKMRNSGEISNIGYGLVYKKEYELGHFKYIKGDTESLEHTPILFEEKGDLIGVYAVVTLKDGAKVREFMDMNQIKKVKASSRSKDSGPWVTWFEEMCVKSVLRKVSKLCPMSSDIDAVFKADDADDADIEAQPEQHFTQEVVAEKPVRQKAADKVKAAVKEQAVSSNDFIDVESEHIVLDEEELPI